MQIHSKGKTNLQLGRFTFNLLLISFALANSENLRANCYVPQLYASYAGSGSGLINCTAQEDCFEPGTGWLEWGYTTSYGNRSSTFTIPDVGTTNFSYQISSGGPTAIMHYRAVGYDSAGTNATADQTFLTTGWVTITNQPQSQTVGLGSNVTFTVEVMSALTPIYYRWSKDGTLITNATSSSLTLTNVQITDSGNYSVQAENLFEGGSFWQTSSTAVLTVSAPSLIAQLSGTNIVLSWPVAASGYTLESSANFGTNTWTAVPTALVTNSSSITATVPVSSAPHRFYRLHHY